MKSGLPGRVLSSFLGPVGMLCFLFWCVRLSWTELDSFVWKSWSAASIASLAAGGLNELLTHSLFGWNPVSGSPSCFQKYLSLMSFIRRSKVESSLGLGRAFSMQNLRPFQSSSEVSAGGVSLVQRLWKAVCLDLYRLKNLGRGIDKRACGAPVQVGRFGLAQNPYWARALSLICCLLLMTMEEGE